MRTGEERRGLSFLIGRVASSLCAIIEPYILKSFDAEIVFIEYTVADAVTNLFFMRLLLPLHAYVLI